MAETCAYPKCRVSDIELRYLGRDLCLKHWQRIARMDGDKAKRLLKIEVEHTGAIK